MSDLYIVGCAGVVVSQPMDTVKVNCNIAAVSLFVVVEGFSYTPIEVFQVKYTTVHFTY